MSEAAPPRTRPFLRWPRAADAVLAATVTLASLVLVDGPGDSIAVRDPLDVPAPVLVLFLVCGAALLRRRREPLAVLAIALGAFAVTAGTASSQFGGVALVALYTAGRHAADRRFGPVAAATAAALGVVDGVRLQVPLAESLVSAAVLFAAWSLGASLRHRAERAAQLVRERAAESRRVVAEERSRIARELHDVVAHRVSLMTVQSGAARAVAAADLDAAVRAMGAVEEAGREALGELRHLLGVLRPDTDGDGLGPQPGLHDLPRVVEQVRRAGLDVTLTAAGPSGGLPDRVDLFAHRIVQEALTNVLKHAGPGARASVRLTTGAAGVAIEVLDDGQALGPPEQRSQAGPPGHGIVGMRERALLLGGRFSAGPRPGGGFAVTAHLPVQEPRA